MKLSHNCTCCRTPHDRWWLQQLVDRWGDDGPPATVLAAGGVLCLPCSLGRLEQLAEDAPTQEQRMEAAAIVDKFTAVEGVECLGIRRPR